MKTTVKLTKRQSISVHPCTKRGGVVMEITTRNDSGAASVDAYHLTPDQCGALLFGFEQAEEAARVATERAGALA